MIRSKYETTSKQDLIKLIQASKVRTFTILEPVENEREVLDLFRKTKGKSITIIIGETQ
jgi:hypothetical protein